MSVLKGSSDKLRGGAESDCAAFGWVKDVGIGVAVALVSRSSTAFRARTLWHIGNLSCYVVVLRYVEPDASGFPSP
jgi:hypothetical protein